jgi:alkylation response protein AidB-like acyl-CoA dehydrogenase
MDWELSDDDRLLVDVAREYARGELVARDKVWDEEEKSLCAILPELAEMGFMNLRIRSEYGGLECPMVVYAHILHELAYASPAVAVDLSVHNMVGEVLQTFGSEELCQQILPEWGKAESLGTFAISEPDAGSDPASIQTRAERKGDYYHLNGSKMWITNALSGRWFMTLARTGDGKRGVSAFWVDGQSPGIERLAINGKMGQRGSELASIHLDDVKVPVAWRLGNEGQGLKVGLASLDGGRIGIASQASGISQACLDEMVSYAKERRQFGRPIADFQAIQFMIADSQVELDASRALTMAAARLRDEDKPHTVAAAEAKLYSTEACNRIAYRAVQVHGGTGYVNESRVERLYRDARATTIYEGTSEIQRIVIARGALA